MLPALVPLIKPQTYREKWHARSGAKHPRGVAPNGSKTVDRMAGHS